MRRLILGLALSLVMTAPALSDASTHSLQSVPSRATPTQIAAARQQGDAILFTAAAADLFDNETGKDGTATIILRHKASGFYCTFEVGERLDNVVVYPNPHRGDDVGCNTITPMVSRTTNFTRDAHSDEQTFGGAAMAIQRRFPGAEPAPPPLVSRPFDTMFPGSPSPKSARFLVDDRLEEVISAHVDGWLVEDRFTARHSFVESNALDEHWYMTVAERLKHQSMAANGAASPSSTAVPVLAANALSRTEEIAVAKEEGERVLLGNSMQDMFENITDSKVIALRHKASGVVCRFDRGGLHAVVLGPLTATSQRSDAISCIGGVNAFQTVLTFMPNTGHLTNEQALSAALEASRSVFPNMIGFTGAYPTLKTSASTPVHVAARMVTAVGPGQTHIYIAAAVVGDWVLIERVSGPVNPPMADLLGEIFIVSAINDITKVKLAALTP